MIAPIASWAWKPSFYFPGLQLKGAAVPARKVGVRGRQAVRRNSGPRASFANLPPNDTPDLAPRSTRARIFCQRHAATAGLPEPAGRWTAGCRARQNPAMRLRLRAVVVCGIIASGCMLLASCSADRIVLGTDPGGNAVPPGLVQHRFGGGGATVECWAAR